MPMDCRKCQRSCKGSTRIRSRLPESCRSESVASTHGSCWSSLLARGSPPADLLRVSLSTPQLSSLSLRARLTTAVVWGFIYATLSTYCTTLSHGEMFAVYPTAGGQYHWAYMVSSPKYRAAVSWFTGMLNVIGLWLGIATAAYLCGEFVPLLCLFHDPDVSSKHGGLHHSGQQP